MHEVLHPGSTGRLDDRCRAALVGASQLLTVVSGLDLPGEVNDRVGIVDHGKLLALDTPDGLTRSLPGSATIDVTLAEPVETTPGLVEDLGRLPGVERVETAKTDAPRIYLDSDPAKLVADVVGAVHRSGATLTDLSFGRASLEDVFISLTGRGLR